jgi:hypothetical protein
MITWSEKYKSGVYEGKCLSKDVPILPRSGELYKNGSEMYIMDTPDGTNATSKIYMFDGENKIWLPQ